MRSTRSGPRGAAALLLIVCGVSACAPPALQEFARSAAGAVEAAAAVVSASPRTTGDALLDFLAGAGEGEVRELVLPTTGHRAVVSAGRAYHAASGRLCRRYTAAGDAIPAGDQAGLACERPDGAWSRAVLLVPASP